MRSPSHIGPPPTRALKARCKNPRLRAAALSSRFCTRGMRLGSIRGGALDGGQSESAPSRQVRSGLVVVEFLDQAPAYLTVFPAVINVTFTNLRSTL